MNARPIGEIIRPIMAEIERRILFRDDSQVTDLIVKKRYSADPRLVVTMECDL